jgi:hypothetical protein
VTIFKREVLLGTCLLALSAMVYGLHYVLFRDAHHIFLYLVSDIAFVFVEVFLVVLIIERLLERREKNNRLQKLNIVIGTFFMEFGTKMLIKLLELDPHAEVLHENLNLKSEWRKNDFFKARKFLKNNKFSINVDKIDWEEFKDLLRNNRNFMLRMLENPTLLEHEAFTDLLQAVFHLTEELDSRAGFAELPDSDRDHMRGDVKRIYGQLVRQWLDYMEYQSSNYPYLYSLSCRTNPFNKAASPIVK